MHASLAFTGWALAVSWSQSSICQNDKHCIERRNLAHNRLTLGLDYLQPKPALLLSGPIHTFTSTTPTFKTLSCYLQSSMVMNLEEEDPSIIDLNLSCIKPLHAQWVVALYNHIKSNPDIV